MNDTYLLPCTCGRAVPVEAAHAGQRVRCACGAELEVPTLLGLRRLARAEAPERGRPTEARWGTRQRLTAAGLLIVLVGLGISAWFYFTCPTIKKVENFRAIPTLDLWESLRAGVDRPATPVEKRFLSRIEEHYRWMAVGLAVAAAGALMLAGSLLLGACRPAESRPPGNE